MPFFRFAMETDVFAEDSAPRPRSFPLEGWAITEDRFDVAANLLDETLFTLGNGYSGQRGTFEEGWSGPREASLEGTYLNGFFDTEPIHYPETAYGLARTSEFMLNVPNAKGIGLEIGGERFDLLTGTIHAYRRSVDFRRGVLVREVEWESPRGHRVRIVARRLVCLARKNVFASRFEVQSVNVSGTIVLTAVLDGHVKNSEAGDDPRFGSTMSGTPLVPVDARVVGGRSVLVQRTRHSGFTLVSATETVCEGAGAPDTRVDGQRLEQRYAVRLEPGARAFLTKYGAYLTTRDYPAADLDGMTDAFLNEASACGFEALCVEQEHYLAAFWRGADVELGGDEALQQGLRFNLFHLLQSAGKDGRTNIAAKGVTGEGYEGHYFWDTEIYVFPVFLHTKPDIARKLLEYRCACLSKARERARQMAHPKGALFPWRTITGEECSAYFPAGTAQYHINADIAQSIRLYHEVTGDSSFLVHGGGAEVLLETARIWMGIGHFEPRLGGQFCINEVTGPDEYTALVNNNLYTNAMARMHLGFAAETARRLESDYPEVFRDLAARIELEPGEVDSWDRAAERMYLPYDETLGIHKQDDGFLEKKVWDFAGTPKENYPLLLHYHPLVIYRHQVCKQADVVLATFLQGDLFTPEQKRRNFDYYEKVTTHDSSLSSCIHAIMAAEVGYADKAYAYFMHTARMDLDNTHGNTFHGVHTAAMAGAWMGVVHGFAGMRIHRGDVSFAPTLPAGWTHYRFKAVVRGQVLEVTVTEGRTEYRLAEGEELTVRHGDTPVRLTRDLPVQAVGTAAATAPAWARKDYRAVVFDLDGVITDTARFHHSAWKRLADTQGAPFDETFAESLKGVDRMGSLEMILARAGRTYSAAEKAELADRKNEWYKELIATITPGDLLPGAVEALRAVRSAGLKTGLASVSKNAPAILERLGITDLFDTVVDAAALKRGKPDPEIFVTAARQLGLDPSQCVGVEDAVAGLHSIKAAGMFAVGVGDPAVLVLADHVIPGLSEFRLADYRAA
jgi:beta-phosphoglucomutase